LLIRQLFYERLKVTFSQSQQQTLAKKNFHNDFFCKKSGVAKLPEPGLPDFSEHNIPKRVKMYQMAIKYAKWP
jgi:hypothetical protein